MSEEKTSVKYELMLLLPPDLGEKATEHALNEVRNLIKEHGGSIYHEDLWGVQELAYIVSKRDSGYYAVLNFEIEPLKLNELKQPLNLQAEILRHLLIKTPHNYELKTLEEYKAEAKKEEEEMEKKKKEEEAKRPAPRPVQKPAPKTEEKTSIKKTEGSEAPKKKEKEAPASAPKKYEPKEEKKTVEKPAEKPQEKTEEKVKTTEEIKTEREDKETARKLDEVDEKLRSIIDDPDISL